MTKVALEALLEELEAGVCAPVKLEVLTKAPPETRARWADYFGWLPCEAVRDRHLEMAIIHSWKLRDTGVIVAPNDLLVAAMALDLNWRLYARAPHFQAMRQILGLKLYEPGPGGSFRP